MSRVINCNWLTYILSSFAACLGFATSAAAHSDIFLANVGGQVAVGGASKLATATPFYELDTQVFEAVLVTGFPLPLVDYGRGEPGVFALSEGSPDFPSGASALLGVAAVSLKLPSFTLNGHTDSLFYWDGSGAVDFEPISVSQPGITLAIDPTPFSDPTSSAGALHFHPNYKLDNGGVGAPADGVYLAAPTASVAGLIDSKRFFIVLLADQLLVGDEVAEGLEETFESGETFYEAVGKDFGFYEEAVAYVESKLVVPEPATLLLGGFAAAGALSFPPRRHAR